MVFGITFGLLQRYCRGGYTISEVGALQVKAARRSPQMGIAETVVKKAPFG